MKSKSSTFVALVALAAATACGTPVTPPPDGGPVPDSGEPALLEVGTGADRFIALAPQDPVDIVKGPQGGYHIWGAVRARAPLKPANIAIVFRVLMTDAANTEVSSNGYRVTLVSNGDFLEWYGMLGLVPTPADISGKRILLRAEVTDASARKAADQREVTARGP